LRIENDQTCFSLFNVQFSILIERALLMIYAVVPVKPLHSAKMRLAGVLTASERRALVLAMLADLLGALRATEAVDQTIVIGRDAEALALAACLGAEALLDRADGLNAAYTQAAAFATRLGATGLLALHADLPLATPAQIAGLLASGASSGGVALAPSRDGGTNGLFVPAGTEMPFRFGPQSLSKHLAAAEELGLPARLFRAPGLELDIDRPDDLLLLAEAPGETSAQKLARELCIDARLACV
jgi:2-phospho-L-lactate guanylyltransferase